MTGGREVPPPPLPPRIAEGEGATADLLRKFGSQTPHVPSEAAVWDRTLARLARDGTRPRLRVVLAAACGALAGAVGIYVLLAPRLTPIVRSPVVEARVVEAPAARAPLATRPSVAAGSSSPTGAPPVAPPVSPPTVSAPALASAPPPAVEPIAKSEPRAAVARVPRIQLGRATVGLPVGAVDLIGEARVTLSRDGRARAFADEEAATVELVDGRVELEVDKRSAVAGRRFDVLAPPYRFTVLGTRFEVARSPEAVSLSVSEGRVAVYREQTLLEVVGGGGRWSSSSIEEAQGAQGARIAMLERPVPKVEPAPFAPAPPSPRASSPPSSSRPRTSLPSSLSASSSPGLAPPSPACADRAGRDARAGLDCYLAQSKGAGLGAEVALYEAARLRRDALSDPAGALATLREYRRRFPGGALGTEVGLSMAELLPKLGRYREALDEITALLAAQPRGERLGELQLLRGHLLREGLRDAAGAERAYAAAVAADADGRGADPAAYWRAVCLETLGRVDDARDAYRLYLARPRAARAAEATQRLNALEREHSGTMPAPSK